jgi:hypothetical protein
MSKIALIIITVAIVAVLVIAGAVYYIMGLGFSDGDGLHMTPAAFYDKTQLESGWQINLRQISETIPWSDVRVLLNDGVNFVEWNIDSADLDGGREVTVPYAARALGALSVTLTVTDLSGNGAVNSYDHFTVSATPAFSSTTNYSTVLLFRPTAEQIGAGVTFTG